MAFIPTVNAIKIVIIGTLAGQQVVIDITIGTPAAVSLADLDDAADAIEDWLTTELMPDLTASYVINEIKAYDLSSSIAPVVSHFVSIAGSQAIPGVANNTALVASFRTDNRGRSGRGRNYVAGMINNVGDTVSTTLTRAGLIATDYANLNSYLTPLGMEHIVISQYTGGSPRVSGLKQPVTEYIVNIDYDSQRKRLAGRGA